VIVQGMHSVVEDYTTPTFDTAVGIKVRDNNPDVRVIGNFYQGKDYVSGGRVGGAVGIQTGGLNCLIQGNTVTGASARGAIGQALNIFGSRGIDGGGNVVNSPDEIAIFFP
jgi:hypothetical protein